jgi:hypothetical protein
MDSANEKIVRKFVQQVDPSDAAGTKTQIPVAGRMSQTLATKGRCVTPDTAAPDKPEWRHLQWVDGPGG